MDKLNNLFFPETVEAESETNSVSIETESGDALSSSDAFSDTESVSLPSAESGTGTVFEPQDVSDQMIESIRTYGDYLAMFRKILGRDTMVEVLKGYRDTLKEYTDGIASALQ